MFAHSIRILLVAFAAAVAPTGHAQEEEVDSLDIYDPEALVQPAGDSPDNSVYIVASTVTVSADYELAEESLSTDSSGPTPADRANAVANEIATAHELRKEVEIRLRQKGGRIVEHTVQRGEDLESIAVRYGVSADEIQAFNPILAIVFTGMVLDVPTYLSEAELRERELLTTNSVYLTAVSLDKQGKYGDAVKGYTQLIEQIPSPPLVIYYNRGLAQYNRDKMRQAMEDFAYVKSHDSDGNFPDADSYYRRASEIQAQRDADKAEMWAGLVGIAATTTAMILANESGGSSGVSSSPASSSSGIGDSGGGVGSADEVGSGSSRSQGRRCQKLTANDLAHCNGTGVCQNCNGEGKYRDSSFGIDHWVDPCVTCGGDGKCPSCGGDGYR